MNVLILYGTSEGQTRKISSFLADQLRAKGLQVTLRDITDNVETIQLDDFDGAIIAARVHAGSYPNRIVDFVTRNRRALTDTPAAFLSVSMSAAALRPGDMEAAERYADKFVRRTGWMPNRILQVAGARLYTHHNAVSRWILGLVDRHRLDTSRDYEWTDWEQLKRFADEFVAITLDTSRHHEVVAEPLN